MTDSDVIDVLAGAFEVAAWVAGPLLLAALAIGVLVSLIQALFQIQEQTLTFVPKIVVSALIMVWFGGWMLTQLTDWIIELWGRIPTLG